MITYTPTNGETINLFPIQKIEWSIKSNVKQAGKIAGTPVYYYLQKGDTVKMSITWVNKTIHDTITNTDVPIDKYIRNASRYGVLDIDGTQYKVAADFSFNHFPVVEGDAYKVSVTFTVKYE
jgi:hypothetical protein